MENWQGKPYYSLSAYLQQKFHQKLYKVSLNAGMTCPNRDGTLKTEAVFSAAQEAAAILPATGPCPLQNRLTARSPRYAKNVRPGSTSPISRHTRIPTGRFPIWRPYFPRPYGIRT